MRLFLGLWPAPAALDVLRAVQETLRRTAPPGGLRFTSPDQIHLTLRFLGEVEAPRVDDLVSRLGPAAGRHAPFVVRLGGPGAFPSAHRARVVWVGVDGDLERLGELRGESSRIADPFAAAPDDKSFHPHFTLARVREPAGRAAPRRRPRPGFQPRGPWHREDEDDDHRAVRPSLADAIERLVPAPSPPWTVTSFRLVASELRPEGPRYVTVAEIPLATTR